MPNIVNFEDYKICTIEDAFYSSDLMVMLVKHDEFKSLELSSDKVVLDFCGIKK